MGAGVILVEHYVSRIDSRIKRSGLAVLLFRDKKTGRFMDAGGSSDKGERMETCASRELKEESLGLFDIDIFAANKQKISLSSGYSAFIVPVRHHRSTRENYLKNLSLIASREGLPYYMKETDDVRRFFLDDLLAYGTAGPTLGTSAPFGTFATAGTSTYFRKGLGVPDAYQETCYLSKRTACVLQKAFACGAFGRRFAWNYLATGRSLVCGRPDVEVKTFSYVSRLDAFAFYRPPSPPCPPPSLSSESSIEQSESESKCDNSRFRGCHVLVPRHDLANKIGNCQVVA